MLPEATDDPYEELFGHAVQLLEQSGEPALQEFLIAHAAHAADIRAGLEHLRRLGILAPPPAAPAERTEFGEFRVLRRIGAGGMGVVYAAEQTSLQRTVALKVVRPEFLLLKNARERFQREVEAIARLQHPGIVPILAVGNEDAQPWFAMDYVDGHTLDELIERMRDKDLARADGSALRTGLPTAEVSGSAGPAVFTGHYWEACTRLIAQVAATMSYVHERGIVHRDLKPSNVVVDRQGRAMVLDFGLAHVRDLQRVTLDQLPIGSPAYVSPEQARGEAVDERVDIYGLGVTLYELLTTQLPFQGQSREALHSAILAGGARSVRTWNRAVPRDLAIVCAVAIDRDRARRYRSMAEFAADLDAVLARRAIRARPLGIGLKAVRWAQRHPTWTVAAVALLLVALQFPLVLWRQQADANKELAKVNTDLEQAALRARESHERALAAAATARRQSTRLHVAEANRRQGDGDYIGALPPLVAALRGSPNEDAEHSTRLAAALRHCPTVVHHWTLQSWRDRRDPNLVYPGHAYSAAFSPDGKWIACATGATHIHFFDVETGADCGSEFAEEGVEFVKFSGDGKRLLTGSNKNTITLWDVEKRTALLRGEKHNLHGSTPATFAAPVMDAAGKRIVVSSKDGVAVLLPDEGNRRIVVPTQGQVRSLALSPDESSLAIGMADGTTMLHDVANWQSRALSVRGAARVLAFSPDGHRLAVISGARTLTLWNLEAPTPQRLGEPIDHAAYAYTLRWSPDGRHVVSGAYGERSALLVNADSGLVQTTVRQAPGAFSAVFSPDGQRLLTAGFDNAARIFATDTGLPDGPPLHHAGYVSVACFSPDGRSIFTGAYDGTARLWRLPEPPAAPPEIANSKASAGGRALARRDWKEGRLGTIAVYDMADGQLRGRTGPGQCAGISDDGRVLVWDGSDGFQLLEFDAAQQPRRLSSLEHPYKDVPTGKREAELSPDARRVVITNDRRRWQVFDVTAADARDLGALEHAAECPLIAFSLDGRLFAAACARPDREPGALITIWDLIVARQVTSFTTLQSVVRLEFSPDARLIAWGGANRGFFGGAAAVHRCDDGQPVTPYLTHRGNLEDLEFSPDGRYLATGSRDSVARLWDVATGALAAPEMLHPHHVAHLSFNRDGTRLVTTTSLQPAIRVWNPATGEALTPPVKLSKGTWFSRFTDDGAALISAGDVFMRWPLGDEGRSPEDLIREAEFLCGRRHDAITGERPIPLAELRAMHTNRSKATKTVR